MKIENIDVEKLKPYEKNAKKHPEEQVEHIANSILEFGIENGWSIEDVVNTPYKSRKKWSEINED